MPGKGSRVACVSAAAWVLWWSGGSPWCEWVCDREMIGEKSLVFLCPFWIRMLSGDAATHRQPSASVSLCLLPSSGDSLDPVEHGSKGK